MKNIHSPSPISNLQVLEVLSDRTTIDILKAVAKNVTSSDKIRELLGLTRKQYYIRYSRLLKTGIIKRKSGKLSLTTFGQLTYHLLVRLTVACTHSVELKLIDEIKSSEMSHNEQEHLIEKLILDDKIKKLIS